MCDQRRVTSQYTPTHRQWWCSCNRLLSASRQLILGYSGLCVWWECHKVYCLLMPALVVSQGFCIKRQKIEGLLLQTIVCSQVWPMLIESWKYGDDQESCPVPVIICLIGPSLLQHLIVLTTTWSLVVQIDLPPPVLPPQLLLVGFRPPPPPTTLVKREGVHLPAITTLDLTLLHLHFIAWSHNIHL